MLEVYEIFLYNLEEKMEAWTVPDFGYGIAKIKKFFDRQKVFWMQR